MQLFLLVPYLIDMGVHQQKPVTNFRRFPIFDEVEILEASGYTEHFPVHFHETICITLVNYGIECTEIAGKKLLAPKGAISLTLHQEAHANPNTNTDGYSFLTFYINPDAICHFLGKKFFRFSEQIVHDESLYQKLSHWSQNPGSNENEQAQSLSSILTQMLKVYTQPEEEVPTPISSRSLREILAYLDVHFDQPISVEKLAQMANSSTYKFIRSFKREKGITPLQYLILKRVECAKRLLREGNTQVDVALRVGFFDQSHFSRNFRKFTGMTPRAYQMGCNSVQELPMGYS